ncbi:adhesion G protein-coupled receptor E3-like isoform X2 [Cyclopterus lumpus]|uniref:adhesion G protein-coupled receptor E3-like isoform X2 n=1 Tax=Cyclopterus lumpus TaxID=8103 RepID=UPI0014865849|nr:adhesion G protein-coupled receptor E3-like isoform X2 [Cyclopterus lumpus]
MPLNNMSWTTWVLFVGLLWSYPVSGGKKDLEDCLQKRQHFVIVDTFNGFITADEDWGQKTESDQSCILFLQNNTVKQSIFGNIFPQVEEYRVFSVLHVSEEYTLLGGCLCVLKGRQCNSTIFSLKDFSCNSMVVVNYPGPCEHTCLKRAACQQPYNVCNTKSPQVENKYIINMKRRTCSNCNLGMLPEVEKELDSILPTEVGEKIDAAKANGFMNEMANVAASITASSVALTGGKGIFGILVKQTDHQNLMEESFGFVDKKNKIYMIEGKDIQTQYSKIVTLPKEAFEKAASLKDDMPFVAILQFNNLISESNPSCRSWNGEGSRPKWTEDGCQTQINNDTITCACSHLTFFAILLAPANQTISASQLKYLTIITQVGCGLSMFFLCIVLFMHFLLRRTTASTATLILIHLVSSMFLLDLTFLINNFVAKLKNSWGCKIEAALMHYFMLTTFTWFAVQAFNLGLNLYRGGQIGIRHYLLKVSITSWVLPIVVGIILFSLGTYGEQVISTNDTEYNVTICWITDNDVHYIVNIGYYVLVFLFTFTTFIIVVFWLFHLKRAGSGSSIAEISTNRNSISIILGLCCMMGITWGFAFFAYGALRIPSYYIFTVLNSFQGFFLFLYYIKTGHSGELTSGQESSASINTVQSIADDDNPYVNFKPRKDM